jgi:hypothetical protein
MAAWAQRCTITLVIFYILIHELFVHVEEFVDSVLLPLLECCINLSELEQPQRVNHELR